jgi:LuxR family maltose regulon positive regulatory protein
MQWIGSLPEEVIQSRPHLLMHQGWVTFLTGNVTQASKILQQAKRALTAIPKSEEKILLHGKLSALLATITALTPDLSTAIAEAEEALALLPKNQFIFRARALRAKGVSHMFLGALEQALSNLATVRELALLGENNFLAAEITSQIGTLRKHQGKLSLAQEAYRGILDLYETPEQSPPACLGYIGLAEVALKRNEFSAADTYLNLGIELCQKGNIGYALQPAYLIGGLIKSALGDEQAAWETIQQGENLSRQGGGSLESILGLAHFQTRLCLQLGELEKARQWVQGQLLPSGWTFDELPITLHEMHQSLQARVALASGEFTRVLTIADQIIPQAEAGGRLGRVIELSLFKAIALQQMGEKDEALESFEKSLTLTEPEGYLRLFLEQGDIIITLLETAIAQGVRPEFAVRILSAFPNHQDAVSAPKQVGLIDPLTGREMEVLNLICEGYSNQKIADAMVVSINTVKKHTSNIYAKLGVRNRAQAVLKAREINLI